MVPHRMACQGASEISSMALNALLREAATPVLVYVWAPWCAPCKTMSPAVDEAARYFGQQLQVVKLNAASESQALAAFGIASVPFLLFFSADGREQGRVLGALSSSAIINWVSKYQ